MNITHGQNAPIPTDVASCLEKAWVTEPNSLQAPESCKKILTAYMRDHSREVVTQWDVIATTDKRKWVLLNLSEALEPAKYMDFLESARTLRESDKISPNMFEVATVMPGQRKEAFLALNYNNPRVRNYVASIRGLLPASQSKYLDEVLSGHRAKDWEERYQKAGVIIGADLLLSETSARPGTPVATAMHGGSSPTPLVAESPMPVVERKSLVWPWFVGIAALTVIAVLVWKRRT